MGQEKNTEKPSLEYVLEKLDLYIRSLVIKEGLPNQEMEDCMQAARLEIIKDYKNYDPNKGMLTTYFHNSIVHGIKEYRSKFLGGTTLYYGKAQKIIRNAITKLEESGRSWSLGDLQVLTNLPTKTLEEAYARYRAASGMISLSDNEFLENETSMQLANSAEDVAMENFMNQALLEAIKELPYNERILILYCYNIIGDYELAVELNIDVPKQKLNKGSLGKLLGLTEPEVSAALRKALKQLKKSSSLQCYRHNRRRNNQEIKLSTSKLDFKIGAIYDNEDDE